MRLDILCYRVFRTTCALLLPVIIVTNFIGVFYRYVLKSPIIYIEEWSLILFKFLITLGILIVVFERSSPRFTLFLDLLNDAHRAWCNMVVKVVESIVYIWLSYYALKLALSGSPRTTPLLGMPQITHYAVLAAGLLGCAMVLLLPILLRKPDGYDILNPNDKVTDAAGDIS